MDRFLLGPWTVDPAGHSISAQSSLVRVSPRAMKVLVALAECQGQVVSRGDLIRMCWGDVFVGDEVLTHAVSELRKALGSRDGITATYIETIPKSGYRLLIPIELLDSPCTGDGSQNPPGSTVAVLPFVDLSSTGDQEYLCDGLAVELINALVRIDRLRVASRTSSFRFRQSGLDVREIGARLNVESVVEGSVRRFGDALRISLQLVDTSNGFDRWSESFDEQFDDVLGLQTEIARQVATALRVSMSTAAESSLRSAIVTDASAYDAYLRGRHQFYRGGRGPTERACDFFREATDLVPTYALAHAGLADASTFLYLYYTPAPRLIERADASSRRAVEIDPELAEARASRGLALAASGPWDEAAEQLDEALRLRPDLFEALYLYGRSCLASGRFDRAVDLFQRAGRARPDDFHTPTLLAKALRGLGASDEATAASALALELVEHHLRLVPSDLRAEVDAISALVELGRRDEAMERAKLVGIRPDEPMLYYLACAYARAGETDIAMRLLAEVVEAGWSHSEWLRHDPDWADHRETRAFRDVLTGLESSQR